MARSRCGNAGIALQMPSQVKQGFRLMLTQSLYTRLQGTPLG
jgi:hypothetical protein